MADVDFDFFDDTPAPAKGKNDYELSPRPNKHGGKKKIETKIPTMRTQYSSGESDDESPRSGKHKGNSNKGVEVAVDSSDSESESDRSDGGMNSKGAHKNAWADNSKSNGVRPKSAHPSGRSARHRNRPAESKQRSRSNSPSGSRSRSRSRPQSRSGSETDSSDYSSSSDSNDSDITDVSPLPSPQSTARSSGRKSRQGTAKYGSMKAPKSPSVKSDASSRSRPTSGKLNKLLLRPDQDSMDLRLLMQAVLEMEQEREREEESHKKRKQPRFYVPQSTSQRKNLSFRNDKTRDIDRENTRLMQQIVRYAAEAKKKKQMQKASSQRRQQPMMGRVLTTSAVNRKREQERIDRENRAMLKRLENAKATTTLRKDKLLNDFNNHTMAGVTMGVVHPLERKKKGYRSPSPYSEYARSKSSMMSDTSSLKSSSTWKSSVDGRSMRPQSAKVTSNQRPLSGKKTRPQSAKMANSSRPEWESGW